MKATDVHIALLQRLVLDAFVAAVKDGPPFKPFHKCILFFRSSEEMSLVASYLITATGYKTSDTAPFAQNHAAVSKTDEAIMLRRKAEYLLFEGGYERNALICSHIFRHRYNFQSIFH